MIRILACCVSAALLLAGCSGDIAGGGPDEDAALDAGPDAGSDAGIDAGSDRGPDGGPPADGADPGAVDGDDQPPPECARDADCTDPQRPVCWAGVCIPSPVDNPDLEALATNTWTRIEDIDTGGRHAPILVYAPRLARFVLAGGAPGGHYGDAVPHYNTEMFDLGTFRWTNAYPDDAPAGYAPESGPTGAPPHEERYSFVDPNGVSRIPMFANAYGADGRTYHQWTHALDEGKLFAFLWNKTVSYDPSARSWTVLDTPTTPTDNPDSMPAGSRMMLWGSMGYDPLHRELVLLGGTAPAARGASGTWLFSLDEGQWRRLETSSETIAALSAQASTVREQAHALLSAGRNRFFVTEAAGADPASMAAALDAAIGELDEALSAAGLAGYEGEQCQRAAGHAAAARQSLAGVSLAGAVTAETLHGLQEVHEALMWAAYALEVEPPPRALSQMAYHPPSGKLVLFGGDGLDRHHADTWLYDCEHRTWQQMFPDLSPAPRAGHALVALPASGRILLAGGFGLGDGHSYLYGDVYRSIPFEMWSYDPAANRWDLLELGGTADDNRPGGDRRGPWPAASNPDDVVLLVPSGTAGRTTWICKVDPARVDAAGTAARGVGPETLAFRGDEDAPHPGARSYDPAFYHRGVSPDPDGTAAMWAAVPANVWSAISPPRQVDTCGWGTSTFDPDRRQVLYWGGGHSEYKGTNVFHYSLATNLWSTGCRPDWVLEWSGGFLCPALLSFQGRPHVPVHAYQAYAYDPPAGKMLAIRETTWLYDVAARRWEFPPVDPPFRADVMHVALETTPDGVVAWADTGNQDDARLFRWDHQASGWQELAKTGPSLPRPWCDGSGMAYDETRNALWLSAGRSLYRYDIDTGALSAVPGGVPAVLGDHALWREQVHLPEADLILLMRRFDGPAGGKVNVAYDPAAARWYAVDLPFSDGAEHEFSWSAALLRDPATGLVLLHNPVTFWVLRFDRATAAMTDITP